MSKQEATGRVTRNARGLAALWAALAIMAAAGAMVAASPGESDRKAPDKAHRGGSLTGKQKITTYLWFNDNAEEAANYYVSIFKNARVLDVSRYGEGGPMPKGTAMIVNFDLEGQRFMALNGGPMFKFNEAISLFVECADQAEVDELWKKLTTGGEESRCGWLKDRYGLSWQIIPAELGTLLQEKDPARARRVTEAFMRMKKIDIEQLKQARLQS